MVRRLATMTEPPERFLERLEANRVARVPGTAVFLTRVAEAIPPLMIQHVSQIGALPQTVVALTMKFEEIPRVSLSNRLELVRVFEGFWHLTVHYGFVEIPDLPSALRVAKDLGCPVDLDNAVYFGAHDEVVRGPGRTAFAVAFASLRLLVPQLSAGRRSVQPSAAQLRGNWAPDRDLAEDLAHGGDDLARDQPRP
jgi:K+ transporter